MRDSYLVNVMTLCLHAAVYVMFVSQWCHMVWSVFLSPDLRNENYIFLLCLDWLQEVFLNMWHICTYIADVLRKWWNHRIIEEKVCCFFYINYEFNKNEKKNTIVGTVADSTRMIVERSKFYNFNTHIKDHSLSWLGTCTSMKIGGSKLDLYAPTYPLSENILSY